MREKNNKHNGSATKSFIKNCALLTSLSIGLSITAIILLVVKTKVSIGGFLLVYITSGVAFEHTGITLGGFTRNKKILHRLAKIRYIFAGSGVLFAVITALFILPPDNLMDINELITSNYLLILPLSIIIGFPYLKVNFLYLDQDGFILVREDKKDKFVRWGAILRRLLLILALVITFTFVIDGFKAGMGLWASLYALIFLSTAPPNIMGKIRLAMLAEITGLFILTYGIMFF